MDENTQSFVKLASELTDRVDALEKENAQLRKIAACAKHAMDDAISALDAKRVVVPQDIVDATLSALVKCGGLAPEQVDESRKILLTDVTAPHRILQSFLDAQSQTKTAAEDGDIAGGTLIGSAKVAKQDAQEACLERMMNVLKMYN